MIALYVVGALWLGVGVGFGVAVALRLAESPAGEFDGAVREAERIARRRTVR